MFALTFAIGIFSYLIFALGLAGLLYTPFLVGLTLIFWGAFLVYKRNDFHRYRQRIQIREYSLFFLVCIVLLIVQAGVNSIGLFGPEIGFDAVWYHLTFSKLYLQYHTIFHIPGGVFFYSDMPKLTEMLYTAGLAFGSDFFPKAMQYFFGLLCCIALYKTARKFFSPSIAILAPVIFYSNLVVGWESISAYIDLSWAFFQAMTLWALLQWMETKKREHFIMVGIIAGLSMTTKILSGASVALFVAFLLWYEHATLGLLPRIQRASTFLFLALVVPLPWLVFSYIHTGNPFYPLFSATLPLIKPWQILTPPFFVTSLWTTFARGSDPVNPLYLISVPFLVVYWKKLIREYSVLVFLGIGGFIAWYITPQSGGGRYALAYMPMFTLLLLALIAVLSTGWKKAFIIAGIFCLVISIGYRAIANYKFLPVITGKETKAYFLSTHLDFSLGDFYDVDGYFAKHIKSDDKVLLYGFHNLYYVDFPYIHSSWAEKGDTFNYVAVQGNGLPERFKFWNLIYFNNTTQVRLYTLGKKVWRY